MKGHMVLFFSRTNITHVDRLEPQGEGRGIPFQGEVEFFNVRKPGIGRDRMQVTSIVFLPMGEG